MPKQELPVIGLLEDSILPGEERSFAPPVVDLQTLSALVRSAHKDLWPVHRLSHRAPLFDWESSLPAGGIAAAGPIGYNAKYRQGAHDDNQKSQTQLVLCGACRARVPANTRQGDTTGAAPRNYKYPDERAKDTDLHRSNHLATNDAEPFAPNQRSSRA